MRQDPERRSTRSGTSPRAAYFEGASQNRVRALSELLAAVQPQWNPEIHCAGPSPLVREAHGPDADLVASGVRGMSMQPKYRAVMFDIDRVRAFLGARGSPFQWERRRTSLETDGLRVAVDEVAAVPAASGVGGRAEPR